MKSAKAFLGMMIVLMLCGQVQAAVASVPLLNFEDPGLTQAILNTTYGSEYGVHFTGWGFSDDVNNEAQINRGRLSTGIASITFDANQYCLMSIDYALFGKFSYEAKNSNGNVIGSANFISLDDFSIGTIDFSSLAGLSLLTFTATSTGSQLFIDNVALSQVPVPGAAILLGSALLGLVGIRRTRTV